MSDALTDYRSQPRVGLVRSEGPDPGPPLPTLAGEIERLAELIGAIDECVADAGGLVGRFTGGLPVREPVVTDATGLGALPAIGVHLTNGEEMLADLARILRILRDAFGA